MLIVESISLLCKDRGITISALEKELGFGKGTIYRWDSNNPSVDKVEKVADYFDVSVDYLLGHKPSDEIQTLLKCLYENPKTKVIILCLAALDKKDLDVVFDLVKRLYFFNDLLRIKMNDSQMQAYHQLAKYMDDELSTKGFTRDARPTTDCEVKAPFGRRMFMLRTFRGISPKALAEAVGVTEAEIWDYEAEKEMLNEDVIKKAADFLETSTDYLLGRKDHWRNAAGEIMTGGFLKVTFGTRNWPLQGVIMPKKQADGRYRQKITVGYDAEGKAVVKYASGRTKKDLEANTAELKKRYVTGSLEVAREVLFEVYAEKWVNTYKKGRKSAGTDENYHSALYVHLIPEFKGRQLRAISSFDLQNLMNSKAGLGKTTIGYIYTVIRNVFNKAAAEGVIDRNPVVGLTKPECEAKERRALTDAEVAATLKVGAEHSDGLLLMVLYYTGLRRGEAIGLQWHDIDFQKSTVTIRRDFDFKTMELGKAKTKAALRTLPVPLELMTELDRVRGIGETFIFQSIIHSAGNKLQAYRNTWEDLRKALYTADTKIEARGAKSILTAHYYRHNYASILYNGGVDVLTAQKWLGHADAKTTLSIYSHLSKEYELQNAEKLNAVFLKVAKKVER